jgi:hypothetical protein
MARVFRSLSLAALIVALTLVPAAAAAGGPPVHELYEWHPNGERNGPELELIYKNGELNGKFGAECGKTWIFASLGVLLNQSTEQMSGTYTDPVQSVGIGSSYRNSEINWYDFKSGGPLRVSISGTATFEKAVGTLSLSLYHMVKPKHKAGRPKPKAKRELTSSCDIHFEAPNFYFQPPAAPEAPPAEPSE